MSQRNLQTFLLIVHEDESLKHQLLGQFMNTNAFIRLMVDLGQERGYRFSANDVRGMLFGQDELTEEELEQVAGGTNSGLGILVQFNPSGEITVLCA